MATRGNSLQRAQQRAARQAVGTIRGMATRGARAAAFRGMGPDARRTVAQMAGVTGRQAQRAVLNTTGREGG